MPPHNRQDNDHTELDNLNTGNASSQPPSVAPSQPPSAAFSQPPSVGAAATLPAAQVAAAKFGKHVGSMIPYVQKSLDGCSVDNQKTNDSQAEAEDAKEVLLIAPKQRTGSNKAPVTFATLPAEIQVKIFQEFLRKPTLNFLTVKKVFVMEEGEDYWAVSYHPLTKANDASAYRLKEWIRYVCPAAWTAREDLRRDDEGLRSIPLFPRLNIGMNTQTEIMCFDFHRTGGSTNVPANRFGRFSRELEFSMMPRPYRPGMTAKMARFERIAVQYKAEFLPSTSPLCQVFGCFQTHDPPFAHSISHEEHGNWKFCPTEFAGFLDLFVNLREAFIIYSPPRGLYHQDRLAAKRYLDKATHCKFCYY